MLTHFNPDVVGIKERIIAYSYSGFGKTRFVTSLPTEKYGDIVYYAADENSELLGSVLKKYRVNEDGSRRIHVLKPDREDPIGNFTEFCIHDWKAEFPKAKTLIVDTYSKVMFDAIMFAANRGFMNQEKHYQFGVPNRPGSQAIPNRNDYQGIQGASRGFLDMIFHHQKDMHIIFVHHEDITQVEGVGAVGGPSHPGRTMTLELPAKFDTVIRLTREPQIAPDGTVRLVVVANTASNGQYIAKIRENGVDGNPLPQVVLGRDPINFWNAYDAISQEANVNV